MAEDGQRSGLEISVNRMSGQGGEDPKGALMENAKAFSARPFGGSLRRLSVCDTRRKAAW